MNTATDRLDALATLTDDWNYDDTAPPNAWSIALARGVCSQLQAEGVEESLTITPTVEEGVYIGVGEKDLLAFVECYNIGEVVLCLLRTTDGASRDEIIEISPNQFGNIGVLIRTHIKFVKQ